MSFTLQSIDPKNLPVIANKATERIIASIQQRLSQFNYNSFSILLEFVSYLKNQPKSISWQQAFLEFPLTPEALFNKYKGGNEALTALLALKIISEGGFHAKILGDSKILSRYFSYPTKDASPWPQVRELLQDISHIFCFFSYVDESDQQEHFLVIKPNGIIKYSSWNQFQTDFPHPKEVVKGVDNYIKARMSVDFILIARKGDQTCRFDLLDGTLLINKNVYDPEIIPYSILRDCQQIFNFPEDFIENLQFLIQNRERLFREIFLTPALEMFQLWSIYKEVEEYAEQIKRMGGNSFQIDVDAMHRGDLMSAKKKFAEIKAELEQIKQQLAGDYHAPYMVALESNSIQF